MELVKKYGKSCALPGVFQGALASLLSKKGFKEVIRDTIINGGGNVLRAVILGAIHGAKEGMEAIPVDWMRKVKNVETILERSSSFSKNKENFPQSTNPMISCQNHIFDFIFKYKPNEKIVYDGELGWLAASSYKCSKSWATINNWLERSMILI